MLRDLRIRRDRLRDLSFLVFPILIVLAFTILFIQYILGISIIQAFSLFLYRLIDASYDLPFDVIESSTVNIGFNIPPPEFHSIFELWLKPFSKNLLGVSYINDTIPKYLEGLLFNGRSTYGISSPNSNLVLELASIHGAFFGFILFLGTAFVGSLLRRRFLRNPSITLQTLLFVPMIMLGPLFCFSLHNLFHFIFLRFNSFLLSVL